MKDRTEKMISCLYGAGNYVVKIVGSFTFLLLTWYSLRYTYYMKPGGEIIPVNMEDSMLWNLLGLAAAFGVLILLEMLEKRTNGKVHIILRRASLYMAVLWVG
ncbi:MAG: hypothetical protein K2O97_06460, partial [Acetatifactor sp.]|nr:hypothetical protein [Acetatifactor sp.]